ncbi:MAG: hypothetical protein M1821_004452 [Bathelium mastoideum]|nr:MAG: hypothetical protein M1821_004452 [Bathelium mastoideum]
MKDSNEPYLVWLEHIPAKPDIPAVISISYADEEHTISPPMHAGLIFDGTAHFTDDTSASTPMVAAIVALMHDALIAAGKPVLGFLYSWIHSGGFQAFTDVLAGNATGYGTNGFPAMEGWEAASGFGTPWFPRLKESVSEYKHREQRPWYLGQK